MQSSSFVFNPKNVFILDDSSSNREILRRILTQDGYFCYEFVKISHFWESIKTLSPMMILLNIRLSEGDGYQICQELKNNPETQEIPVILLSDDFSQFDKTKGFTVGSNDYLIAPFESIEVLMRVNQQIKLKSLQNDHQQKSYTAHQKYQTILATTSEGFWVVGGGKDNKGKILEVNDAYCRMTGYSREELLKITIADVEVLQNSQEIQDSINRIIEKGSEQFESIHRGKEGQLVYFEISVNYLADLQLFVGFFREISERKQRESLSETAQKSLETEVYQQKQEIKAINQTLQQQLGERQQIEALCHYLCKYIPVMLHSLDSQGNLISVSDYWLKKLGYTREEVINQPFSKFLTVDSHFSFEEVEFPRLLEQGEEWEIPYQVICRNQTIIDVILSSTAERGLNGEILRFLSVMIDVTESKRIETALRQSESRLHTIVNSTTDGLLIVDKEGIVQFANPSAAILLNEPLNSLINLHFGSPIVVGHTAEIDIRHSNHEIGVGEMSVAETEWEGKPVHVISIRDITDRKYTALALQEQQDFLKAIFEQAAVGLALIKAHGELKQVNQRFCEITGYSEAELLKINVWEMTHPEDHKQEIPKIRKLFANGHSTFAHEKRLIRKNGQFRWVNMAVSLASDPLNTPYLIGVIEDIQHKKQFEADLAQSLVRERTISQIIERMRQSLDLETIFQTTTQDLREALNCDRVAIYRFNSDWNGCFIAESVLEGWKTVVNSELACVKDTYLQETHGGRYQHHETLKVDDIYSIGYQDCHLQLLEQLQAKAYAISPVFLGEKLWGLLAAYHNLRPHSWKNEEMQLLEQVSNQLGVAVQQAQLVIEIQEKSQELLETAASVEVEIRRQWQHQANTAKAVDRVVDKIREVLDVETIFKTATREARLLLNVDRVVLYRFNEDLTGRFIAESRQNGAFSLVKEQESRKSFNRNISDCYLQSFGTQFHEQNFQDSYFNSPQYEADRTKSCFVATDIYKRGFSDCYLRVLEEFKVRAYLIAPVVQGGELWGLLAAYESHHPRSWEQWEIEAIMRLGDQLGIALQQANYVKQIQQKSSELFQATQAEWEMRQAKEAADAANMAKSEFLAKMSHELRTPLNAILGFTQIMQQDSHLEPQQSEYLSIIGRSGEHLLTLINDILEMSKIEAGRISLKENDFNLNHFLASLKEMFLLKAINKGLNLIFDTANDLPATINTDEIKLRQVLINLLGNAIKFTTVGQITLKVYWYQSKSHLSLPLLYFAVEDTGPGILPEEAEKLFDPFGQTSIGQQSQQGTGLGLPISRKFVQLMGGDLDFESPLDQELATGARFYFSIPVKIPEIPIIPPLLTPKKVIGLADHQPQYRILVVEDNPENRHLLVELLRSIDLEVKAVENGEEAINIWQTWQPHFIWMDISMPVMDGYTATQIIRTHPQGKETIIVALTASAFEEEKARILAAGCNEVVRKPLQIHEIYETMGQYLGINYKYEESLYQESPNLLLTSQSQTLTSTDLQKMSQNWLMKLYHAAAELDEERIRQLIAKIPSKDASLAQRLQLLSDQLRFDQLMELIQPLVQ